MKGLIYVVPVLHPAAILRGRFADEPAQIRYLRRALSIASGNATPPTFDAILKGAYLDPTWPDTFEYWRAMARLQLGVAVDIECAGPHLVCVGLCPIGADAPIVVHFRRAKGEPAWPDQETTEAVVSWLYAILADPTIPKWFHNGQAFDIPYLEACGFEVKGYTGDTLLLARYLTPEQPADLQSLAIHWLGYPGWKFLKNEETDSLDK